MQREGRGERRGAGVPGACSVLGAGEGPRRSTPRVERKVGEGERGERRGGKGGQVG